MERVSEFLDPCEHVFAEDVEFDVDGVTGFEKGEVGMFPGVRDEGNGEFIIVHIHEGEADAVNANGAFWDEELVAGWK